jgi:hypothetical protein
MRSFTFTWRAGVVCAAVLAFAAPAGAQALESVGTRALGMGGAFVAVADDLTAVYWNPAGLVNGPIAEASIQYGVGENPLDASSRPAASGGWRASNFFACFALPSFGVSFLRTSVDEVRRPTAEPSDGRHNDRPAPVQVAALSADQLGVTVLQSVVSNVAAGTTLKLVRGSFAAGSSSADPLSAALDQASALPATRVTRFDLDVGVLGWIGPVRLGLVGRNLLASDFGDSAMPGSGLQRQVRVGLAVTPGFVVGRTASARPTTTVSLDADLTETWLPTGTERHVAVGAERWMMGGRVAVRGGVRANTIGSARVVGTAGASIAIRPRVFVEAQGSRGGATAGQSWSVAGRFAY